MENNQALTVKEVAAILKVAPNTVYELIKRGEIHSYKVGRKIRFTSQDIENYIHQIKEIPQDINQTPHTAHTTQSLQTTEKLSEFSSYSDRNQRISTHTNDNNFIICGRDPIFDALFTELEHTRQGLKVLRAYSGSYESLTNLYHGDIQAAAIHMWYAHTNEYNLPYVKTFLPGIPAIVIHLLNRTEGFYVQKGNPLAIHTWEDLTKPNIRLANREPGSGVRILLDQQLQNIEINGTQISGYEECYTSHELCASAVANQTADVGVGLEKNAPNYPTLDFVPLQTESYDLVVRKSAVNSSGFQIMMSIFQNQKFQEKISAIPGYDITDIGKIIAEI